METRPNQEELAILARNGERALADLFSRFEHRLDKLIRFRLDQRLWGRVDPADVLQEAYIEASARLKAFLTRRDVPVFVWLRSMTEQVLINVHRRHLGAKIRDARVEVSMRRKQSGPATSFCLAARLIGNLTSPSHAAIREEMIDQLRKAFDTMDPIDREVLALRHFEELSNTEVAEILGLGKAAASNRYIRALKRLRGVMSKVDATT